MRAEILTDGELGEAFLRQKTGYLLRCSTVLDDTLVDTECNALLWFLVEQELSVVFENIIGEVAAISHKLYVRQ